MKNVAFKALFIITFTLFVIALFFFLPLIDKFAWILIIDKLVLFIIAFLVFCHNDEPSREIVGSENPTYRESFRSNG